ncbi:MAG: DNA polymerase III subunit delta, partial [Leptospiraceae bacterium]|nr:DNA polymerase III subunit delta [Leptospiraceae bacterium]
MSETKVQVRKKEVQEFKTVLEVLRLNTLEKLPRIFIYVSQESFEFDLIVDHYKQLYNKLTEPYEIVVYVAEEGEQESLFSELFNMSMFSSWKLIIIKFGNNFFKPILSKGYEEYVKNFKRSLPHLDEKISLLIHYDKKEIPFGLSALFLDKFALLKSKVLYPNERLKELESILKTEKITFDVDASDEFIHRIPPYSGAYIKNVQKLKFLIPKKHYTKED